jgi:hypothetical protein
MKNRILRGTALMLVIGGLVMGLMAPGASAATLDGRGGPGGTGGTLPPLDPAEVSALNEAMLEEYGALNLYTAVISQYGSIIPFSNIARAEAQHVATLRQLFVKYGLAVPANPGLTPPPTFPSFTAACQAGVDAEIADAALYDELLSVTDNRDVVQVYRNLQGASLNNHLPAFEACN